MHPLRTIWSHQSLQALNQAWHQAALANSLPPDLLTRSVAILKALQKYTTHPAAQVALQRAQQQIEQHLSDHRATPSVLDIPPAAQYVPWFDPRFPYPATATDLALDAEWKKQLKAQRDQPYQRLQLALSKLPYRLAYQEAILALRAIVRRNTSDKDQALRLLYWLAASASFLESSHATPAGDLIIAALAGSTLQQLPIQYSTLGTQHLSLLTPTDIKNLEQHFGLATQHATLAAQQVQAWQRYQEQLTQLHATK